MTPDELPSGFKRCPGNRAPTSGKWHIQLRCGFVDTRIAYEPHQLNWRHEGHSGDIISAYRIEE